jgi:hypothetical protein
MTLFERIRDVMFKKINKQKNQINDSSNYITYDWELSKNQVDYLISNLQPNFCNLPPEENNDSGSQNSNNCTFKYFDLKYLRKYKELEKLYHNKKSFNPVLLNDINSVKIEKKVKRVNRTPLESSSDSNSYEEENKNFNRNRTNKRNRSSSNSSINSLQRYNSHNSEYSRRYDRNYKRDTDYQSKDYNRHINNYNSNYKEQNNNKFQPAYKNVYFNFSKDKPKLEDNCRINESLSNRQTQTQSRSNMSKFTDAPESTKRVSKFHDSELNSFKLEHSSSFNNEEVNSTHLNVSVNYNTLNELSRSVYNSSETFDGEEKNPHVISELGKKKIVFNKDRKLNDLKLIRKDR